MVKRTQRGIGRLFTVSGCIACFRRQALHDIGYWSPETVTEDIDVSWRLQLRYWDIRYEPRALAWVVMPETLRGLWRQRLRWASGGIEAAIRYRSLLKGWTKRRMWPVYAEYVISATWSTRRATSPPAGSSEGGWTWRKSWKLMRGAYSGWRAPHPARLEPP